MKPPSWDGEEPIRQLSFYFLQTNQNARISNNSQSEAAYTKHDNRLPCLPRKQDRLNVVFQKESTDGRRTQNIAPYRRTMKIL